jgi:RimJ/RimL family protein N-acetyltransferase
VDGYEVAYGGPWQKPAGAAQDRPRGVFEGRSAPGSPADPLAPYTLYPVTSAYHLEFVRQVRNASREHMTRDQRYISLAEQERWFASLQPRDRHELWVMLDRWSIALGYAYLRLVHGVWWLTYALAPVARGQGRGVTLLGMLPARDYWAEVFLDNIASLKTLKRCGFTAVDSDVEGRLRLVLRCDECEP